MKYHQRLAQHSTPSGVTGAVPFATSDPDAKRSELENRLKEARSPFPRAESFAVNELIDPRETRPALCDWIEWVQPKLEHLTGPVSFPIRP